MPPEESISVACIYYTMKQGGGGQMSVRSLVRGLDPERFRPYLIIMHREPPEIDLSGMRVLPTPPLSGRVPHGTQARFALSVARLVRRHRIDVLHSHVAAGGVTVDGPVVLLARAAGAATVRTVRAGSALQPEGRGCGLLSRALHPFTDAYTVVSPDLLEGARRVARVPQPKLHAIPNGIELAPFLSPAIPRREMRRRLGLPADALLMASVGSLHAVKDYPTMLDGFALAAPELPGARLLIAGEGPERPALEAQIARHGLEGRVRLVGMRDDVPELLGAADMFCMSSECEGMPRAAMEAMAAGLPVVATDVSGLHYALDEGRAGLLVPPGEPEAMARAIVRLGRDPSLRRELAEKARRRALKEFSVETMVQRYENLYLSLRGHSRKNPV